MGNSPRKAPAMALRKAPAMALRNAQRGVVLFIALIVLVAMSLAGLALMRSVDTGTLIASNLAFRQSATHLGDTGIEAGFTWLKNVSPASTLYNDNPGITGGGGYFANWAENLDLIGNTTPADASDDFNWGGANAIAVTSPAAGYSINYVIHRLCKSTGDPVSITCVKQSGAASSSSSGSKGAAAFGVMAISVPTNALYRVTVRVAGPRNTVSYVQAVVF